MIEVNDDNIVIEAPELAQELAKRVVGGLLKACRAYVPTRENAAGKKEHCDVSLMNGALYLGTDHSVYAAVIRPKIVDFCKKKSPLRAAMEAVAGSYNAKLNYGAASPWLKTHEKNIRGAVIGADGIRLIVAENLVTLDLSPTDESHEYAMLVEQMLAERVREEHLISGPHPIGASALGMDVLVVAEEAYYCESIDLSSSDFQMKFRPELLPKGEHEVRLYADPEGGKIVRFTTDDDTAHVEQYFRVLDLVD